MDAPQMKESQKGRVECACTIYLHSLLSTIQPPIQPTKQPKSHLPPSSTSTQNSRSVIPPVILMHTNYTNYTHAYPHPATQARKITAKNPGESKPHYYQLRYSTFSPSTLLCLWVCCCCCCWKGSTHSLHSLHTHPQENCPRGLAGNHIPKLQPIHPPFPSLPLVLVEPPWPRTKGYQCHFGIIPSHNYHSPNPPTPNNITLHHHHHPSFIFLINYHHHDNLIVTTT